MKIYSALLILICLLLSPGVQADPGPKNVILMIGDGMGFSQIDAASLYTYGKSKGQPYWAFQPLAVSTHSTSTEQAYDPEKSWASFDHHLTKPTDSAAAATALSTGVKTSNGRIGLSPNKKSLRHLVEDAEALHKATGLVTTVTWIHATPAAFVAHTPSRNDAQAIAQEMIRTSALDLLIGAGHPHYDDDSQPLSKENYSKVGGETLWRELQAGRAGGDADGDGVADPWTLTDQLQDFDKLPKADFPKRLLGVLPVTTTLQFKRSGDQHAKAYAVPLTPKLPDMPTLMRGALNFLSQDKDGFFLMAEGGAIDWAGHENLAGRLIEEQLDFDRAIEATVAWVEANSSWDDTLLIITADHETGYLYGEGSNPNWKPLQNNGADAMPGTQWHTHKHTNQLVPLFAKGNAAPKLLEYIKGQDPRRGPYIDNTDIPTMIRNVWR